MSKIIKPEEGESFDIELEEDLLKANAKIAEENKSLLKRHKIIAIDIMGSIGSGKTSLIEQIVKKLKNKYAIGVLNGDLTTTIDSDRVRKHGAKVVQINTGKECHLDANLVRKALKELDLDDVNLLLIENVGNLICPAEFPLGSNKRMVIISTTEGPYMVLKHPFIFMDACAVVINKIDLAEAMGVSVEKLKKDALSINPRVKIVKTNCRTGEGVSDVVEALDL